MHTKLEPITLHNPLASNPQKSPSFYVPLTYNDNELLLSCPKSLRAMVACMDMNAVMGGAASHYGGPAAFAEIMSTTYGLAFHLAKKENKEWYELFHIINDAGHCENVIYALKANYSFADLSINSLKAFRSIQSKLTGHGESHLFPEGVYLSNGPLGSALPQAQGLALADQLSGVNRITICTISDGAAMEGEAKEAFTAIPGLAQKSKLAPFICILSDNNTKLSGRISEDAFDMAMYFDSLETSGWYRLVLEDGNDLQACLETFSKAYEMVRKDPTKPILIHAKTIKGIGTKKTAESASGGHGFPLKDPKDLEAFVHEIYHGSEIPTEISDWVNEITNTNIASNKAPLKVPSEKIQVGIAKALIEKRSDGYPIVSISSDLAGSTGIKTFQQEFTDSFIDIGVAESNMISCAAGLSKSGYIPIVDTFAQFGVTKGALPFIMSSLSQAPMIAVFSHTGFQDAADGASHQALSYFSMLNSIPNVNTYALSCSSEAHFLMSQALDEFYNTRKANKVPNSYIFFLGRENFPRHYKKETNYQLGKAQILIDSSDDFDKSVSIVAVGSLLPQAMKAHLQLKEQGIGCIVINPSCINTPDTTSIIAALNKTKNNLVILEDHQEIGGFNNILCTELIKQKILPNISILAVQQKFGQSAYKADELYKKHSIDATAVVEASKKLLQL